ncbi:MAG: hypothetical protein WC785_06815 [Tatlockia sp.]|jgi:hypothetical protein
MPKPIGHYFYSEDTLCKAESYLKLLANRKARPGGRLQAVLKKANLTDFNALDAKQLLALLMNTRKPKIFAEIEPLLDGTDWNLQENAILGDMVFSTTGTHAFNNGAHYGKQTDHQKPLATHFLFISSALLRNDNGKQTSDMQEVLVENQVDEDAFYKLYERRLLPGLLIQNEQARKDNTLLVINIPGLGCGAFGGEYESQCRAALPRILKRLFETHSDKLDAVHTINYDPFEKLEKDEFTTDTIPGTQIRLMARPYQGLPEGATGSVASQLEFPKDGTDYTNCRLLKIVAWDHFSFPGNDLWVNNRQKGNGRQTDDGVSFASSDVVLALFNMGQFGSKVSNFKIQYDKQQGIAYAIPPKSKNAFGYEELAKLPSCVSVKMIDVVSTSGAVLTPGSEEIQKNKGDFERNKIKIQQQFIANLNALQDKLKPSNTKGTRLHGNLLNKQAEFFKTLTSESTEKQVKTAIADFRTFCKEHIATADKLMGHGWLYRIAEVLIKTVVGLFAGIGMVLGSLVCQGLVKSSHRQKFANTFFTLNQTDESKALAQFKQEILGDEKKESGLLSQI